MLWHPGSDLRFSVLYAKEDLQFVAQVMVVTEG